MACGVHQSPGSCCYLSCDLESICRLLRLAGRRVRSKCTDEVRSANACLGFRLADTLLSAHIRSSALQELLGSTSFHCRLHVLPCALLLGRPPSYLHSLHLHRLSRLRCQRAQSAYLMNSFRPRRTIYICVRAAVHTLRSESLSRPTTLSVAFRFQARAKGTCMVFSVLATQRLCCSFIRLDHQACFRQTGLTCTWHGTDAATATGHGKSCFGLACERGSAWAYGHGWPRVGKRTMQRCATGPGACWVCDAATPPAGLTGQARAYRPRIGNIMRVCNGLQVR